MSSANRKALCLALFLTFCARPLWAASTPFGFLDTVSADSGITGWACDADDYTQPLAVHIYADGPAGATGARLVTSGVANLRREPAVGTNCGGNTVHGFIIPLPASLKDNKQHNIYAYAINIGSGANTNPLLTHSPIALPPTLGSTPVGFLDVVGADGIAGWTCDGDAHTQALEVHFYADAPVGTVGSRGLGSALANLPREAAVGDRCGGHTAHGFNLSLPATLRDARSHSIYAYAINIGPAGPNPLLSNAPRTLNALPALPAAKPPIGFLDAVSANGITGWACDEDNYDQALDIHIYADGTASSNFVTATKADLPREAAVGARCGTHTAHGFRVSIPTRLRDNKPHAIYAYAINIGPDAANPLLIDAPMTLPAMGIATATPTAGTSPTRKPTGYGFSGDSQALASGFTVTVDCSPSEAHILYSTDGIKWNDTNQTTYHVFTQVGPGTYWVKLVKDGFVDYVKGFELSKDLELFSYLIEAGAPVSLYVNSRPDRARILYSNDAGFTWTDSNLLTPTSFEVLPRGSYELKLVKEQYADWVETVMLGESARYVVDHRLIRDGDRKISALFDGSGITISTASAFAGAISSLVWKGKEFVNAFDHGREIQSAASFDDQHECFNPTEAGSRKDFWDLTRTTSELQTITASSNRLSTRTRMAFWLAPGETSIHDDHANDCLAANTTELSNHIVSKTVTIGYQDIANVIDYQVTFSVPEAHARAQFEAVTPYLAADFSSFWTYNPNTQELRYLSDGPGEQGLPVILATQDGSYALGVYAPALSQVAVEPHSGYGRWNHTREMGPSNKSNIVFRRGATPAGDYTFQCFLVVGTINQVRDAIRRLHAKPFTGAMSQGLAALGPRGESLPQSVATTAESTSESLASSPQRVGATSGDAPWMLAGSSRIAVSSMPSGARIWYSLNGGPWVDTGALTPHIFANVGPGVYAVKLVKAGFLEAVMSQPGSPGRDLAFDGFLRPAPAPTPPADGEIWVTSTPSGASVWYSPSGGTWTNSGRRTPYFVSRATPGVYQVRLAMPGYADWVGTGELRRYGVLRLNATLAPSR